MKIQLPVRQGYTLLTPVTRKFTLAEWKANEHHEACRVFENFSGNDYGQSRRLLAVCPDPDTANELVGLINNTTTKIIDLGPVAVHNVPCSVEPGEPAVYNMNQGVFEPSWKAQAEGWRLVKFTSWQIKILKLFGILRA